MATLRYQYALVGWCANLKSPTATQIPVGILLTGTLGDQCVAATMALRPADSSRFDPITAVVLGDVARFIRDHVEAVAGPGASPEDVIVSLHRALRNSLHVMKITESATRELEDASGWSAPIMAVLQEIFLRELKASGAVVAAPLFQHLPATLASTPPPATPWELLGANPSAIPDSQLWGLGRRGPQPAACVTV